MTPLTRIEGLTTPTHLTTTFTTAVTRTRSILNRRRALKREQQSARELRKMQEEAYTNSLAQDRAREEQERRQAEESALLEFQRLEKSRAQESHNQKREQWRLWKTNDLKRMGLVGMKSEIGKTARVGLRLANGERIVQMFPGDISLAEVYSFVECYDLLFPSTAGVTLRTAKENIAEVEMEKPKGYEHEFMFRLVVPYPRKVIGSGFEPVKNESALWPSGSIVVEEIENDSEEEDTEDES
jgi:FAS-associated factor 2